jgi:DNA-directed RNA polymerase subunit H (RpoH/RPB5)
MNIISFFSTDKMNIATRNIRMFPQELNRKIIENVVRMFVMRGVLPVNDLTTTVNKLYDNMDTINQIVKLPGVFVLVIFQGKLSTLAKMGSMMNALNDSTVANKLVVVDSIQLKPLRELISYGADVFSSVELMRDPINHVLVPKHQVITNEERAQLIADGVLVEQLPRIDITDMVVRYLGFQVGDVIKVLRPSPTTGISIQYRLVTAVNNRDERLLESIG